MVRAEDDQIYEALEMIVIKVKELLENHPPNRKTYIATLAQLSLILRLVSDVAGVRLLGLAAALSDLDQGIVPALLRPATIGNRPGNSSGTWAKRTHAVLALECLHRTGESLENGARELSRLSKIPAKSLVAWRHDLKAGRVKNALAKIMFENGVARLNAGECGPDLHAAALGFIGEAAQSS